MLNIIPEVCRQSKGVTILRVLRRVLSVMGTLHNKEEWRRYVGFELRTSSIPPSLRSPLSNESTVLSLFAFPPSLYKVITHLSPPFSHGVRT